MYLRCHTLWLLCLLATSNVDAVESEIRFADDIRPVLSEYCFECHGPDGEQRQADLRLDTHDGLLGAIDLDHVADSEILRRVKSADPDEVMPPPDNGKSPTNEQVDHLSRWISDGAKWEEHWSFEPVRRPRIPDSKLNWGRNAVDNFVAAKAIAQGLRPSPSADKNTLLRRLYLDVLGILPTLEQQQRFERDRGPDAFDRVVDEVLASPHFGERWGRHWLDQARYADSDGYSIDGTRTMWPYRDWVIRAFNTDMPFDQFTVEQLAGDLLPNPTTQQLVATGFHRNTLVNQEGGSDPEQFRNETVIDRVNTTGAVWLGLTVACAQCHAHKFDPITHEEYYQLFAYFNSGQDRNSHDPRILAAPEDEVARYQQLRDDLSATQKKLKALPSPKDESTTQAAKKKTLTARTKSLQAEIRNVEAKFGRVMIMRDLKKPRDTHVLVRGDFLRPDAKVSAGVPQALGSIEETNQSNRLELANWLIAKDNPLTARVTVNRLWMQLFGKGLVETENDFGVRGNPPTHPLLLDWLASEYMRNGWSTKHLLRTMLLSSTYRQSSVVRESDVQRDPANTWLARQSRLRVSAEVVRDLFLSAAGVLTDQIGGPSVFPPQPGGVYSFTQNKKRWVVSPGGQRFRRGIYTQFFRSAPHPFLTSFDTPNFQTACTQRIRSNTPLQSLTLANDESLLDAARAMSRTVNLDELPAPSIRQLFRRAMTREPRKQETKTLVEFWSQQRESFEADVTAARSLTETKQGNDDQLANEAAWIAVCRVILNLDEFVVRN